MAYVIGTDGSGTGKKEKKKREEAAAVQRPRRITPKDPKEETPAASPQPTGTPPTGTRAESAEWDLLAIPRPERSRSQVLQDLFADMEDRAFLDRIMARWEQPTPLEKPTVLPFAERGAAYPAGPYGFAGLTAPAVPGARPRVGLGAAAAADMSYTGAREEQLAARQYRAMMEQRRQAEDLSAQITGIVRKFETAEQWEDFLNYFLERYI